MNQAMAGSAGATKIARYFKIGLYSIFVAGYINLTVIGGSTTLKMSFEQVKIIAKNPPGTMLVYGFRNTV
jgi:hypothetical protein